MRGGSSVMVAVRGVGSRREVRNSFAHTGVIDDLAFGKAVLDLVVIGMSGDRCCSPDRLVGLQVVLSSVTAWSRRMCPLSSDILLSSSPSPVRDRFSAAWRWRGCDINHIS